MTSPTSRLRFAIRLIHLCTFLVCGVALPDVLFADDDTVDSASSIQLGETRTHKIKVGIKIQAHGAVRGILASVPVPMDWPEQKVQVIKEEVSVDVRSIKPRFLDDGVKQMLINIPKLNPGETAEAVWTFAVTRQTMAGPQTTENLSIPRRVPKPIKKYLGSGPFIETRNRKIKSLARQILKDAGEDVTDWEKVEAIYDYVRDNTKYQESELKGAVQTLQDGIGDCEAMTSLFIALARAAKIPARMVWVLDHSYPEFYLEDDDKNGHWFPCQISGSRAFGSMPETRTIIQKGDNYFIPETKKRRRYVAVQLKAARVRGAGPQITEIMQMVD